MRTLKILFVLINLLTFTFECQAETTDLDQLKNDLLSNNVVKVKVIYLSYGYESFGSITTEGLNGMTNTTVISTNVVGELRSSLINAIENTKVSSNENAVGIRWGAIFYDKNGHQIHSIYLDARYKNVQTNRGLFDGHKILVNDALIDWFEKQFFPIIKSKSKP